MHFAALVLAGLTACSTVNRSTGGPIVRSLHIEGDQLVVESCEIEYEVDHREGQKAAALAVVIPLVILAVAAGGGGGGMGGGGGGGDGKARSIGVSNCRTHASQFTSKERGL